MTKYFSFHVHQKVLLFLATSFLICCSGKLFSQKDSHDHDEDSTAVKLHRSMIMKNLYSEKVDTNTNIGTWLKKNKNKYAKFFHSSTFDMLVFLSVRLYSSHLFTVWVFTNSTTAQWV